MPDGFRQSMKFVKLLHTLPRHSIECRILFRQSVKRAQQKTLLIITYFKVEVIQNKAHDVRSVLFFRGLPLIPHLVKHRQVGTTL